MPNPVGAPRPPIGPDRPVVFPKSTAVRVLNATRYTEGQYRNTPPGRRDGGDGGGGGIALAALSGSLLNATSATAPTSQTAVFRTFDGTTISAGTTTVTVWNYHNKTFASGALVLIVFTAGAWWVIDARDCPT